MDIPTEKKVITVKPSKKKTNTDDKNAADVVLFDSGKNSRLHQFIRLFFMNKSDQTVEINRIRRADRRLMDEQATAACVVTDFSIYSTAVLWLLICLLVIAAAVYCGVRTISSEEESTITVMILPVLILLSVPICGAPMLRSNARCTESATMTVASRFCTEASYGENTPGKPFAVNPCPSSMPENASTLRQTEAAYTSTSINSGRRPSSRGCRMSTEASTGKAFLCSS